MADALSGLVESPQPERLATGFVFTEGPLWHPEGFYYFVDIRQSRLHRVFPGKTPELVRDQTGEGNGTTFNLQDLKTLFFTAKTSIYSLRMKVPGQPHPWYRTRPAPAKR